MMPLRSWVAGVAATTAVLVAAAFFSANDEPADLSIGPVNPVPCSGDPATLAAAVESAPFDAIQPNSMLASAGNLVRVWTCPNGGVVLEYLSGISVWESLNDLSDPEKVWRDMARLYEEFSVGEINGIPASLADPAVDDATVGVDFVVDGVRYTVSGDGTIPLGALVDVARSMRIPAAAD